MVCVCVPHLRAAVGAIYTLYIYIWCVCARAPPACSCGWLSGASEGAGMVAKNAYITVYIHMVCVCMCVCVCVCVRVPHLRAAAGGCQVLLKGQAWWPTKSLRPQVLLRSCSQPEHLPDPAPAPASAAAAAAAAAVLAVAAAAAVAVLAAPVAAPAAAAVAAAVPLVLIRAAALFRC